MNVYLRQWQLSAAGVVLMGVIIGALTSGERNAASGAQPPKGKTDPLVPKDGTDVSTGTASCRLCHAEKAANPTDNGFAKRYKSHEFVLLNEASTWQKQDPHSVASQVLAGPLRVQMAKWLKYDVTKASQCLSCHATSWTTVTGVTNVEASEGVSCGACHGVHKRWQAEHYAEGQAPAGREIPWRSWSPEKKESEGMRNLRDPVVAARLCVSCHVGNAAEGKVLTHDMYAAGHPPLPPFELASFLEAMPRHWAYPTDERLKYFASLPADQTWKLFRFHPADKEAYQARRVAVGAVAAFRAEAELLAADAKTATAERGIDYARFECFACHHPLNPADLKVPLRRGAVRGRPLFREGGAETVRVVAQHAVGVSELTARVFDFKEKWDALRQAGIAKAFGDPKKVQIAADAVVGWCDAFLRVQSESLSGKLVLSEVVIVGTVGLSL